jgi:inorganic pyrophosphatase/exopolyphosphatase
MDGMPGPVVSENVVEVIDHREQPGAEEDFPNAKIQNELVGAAATLIAEKFYPRGTIDKNSAVLLYGAIYSNTLNLKSTNTTDRDREAIKWLFEKVPMPRNLVKEMFESKSKWIEKDLEKVLEEDAKGVSLYDKRFDILQIEVVGLEKLIDLHKERFLRALRNIKFNDKLDGIFLTAIDLEGSYNIFISEDEFIKDWLEKALDIKFEGDIAKREGLILRKQILPKLRRLNVV